MYKKQTSYKCLQRRGNYLFGVVLCGVAICGLVACDSKKIDTKVLNPTTEIVVACGVAPAGDYTAERIVSANTTRTEPNLYEGPVWINGALYFSDFIHEKEFPSRIQRLNNDGTLTTVIEDSGSNGLAVDASGNIVAGTHKYKSVSRYNLMGERTSVAEKFNGNLFNSPNDLTIAKDGTIYFTDPDYQRAAAPGGQEKTSVYRIATDGTVTLVDDSLQNPNGISLSLNGDTLYVNGNNPEGKGLLRAYPIVNGVPQTGKDLITDLVSADGMALDCHGNIYITEHVQKHVRVFTPQGQQLATINVDANITNAAFGGEDGKTLFLTGAGSLWKIKLDVTGTPY